VYDQCATSAHWRTPFLNSVPATIRLIQCIRRYRDSDYTMRVHLVNGGKYASTVAANFVYFIWRHAGAPESGSTLAVFTLITAISGMYRAGWDLLMDWAFLRKNAKPKFLRDDLTFRCSPIWLYFLMVANIMIRCIALFYIPPGGLNLNVRSFMFAFLEVVRRIMWNLIRVENEHARNVHAYRVIQPAALNLLRSREPSPVRSPPLSAVSSAAELARPTQQAKDQKAAEIEGGARGRFAARDYERRESAHDDDEMGLEEMRGEFDDSSDMENSDDAV